MAEAHECDICLTLFKKYSWKKQQLAPYVNRHGGTHVYIDVRIRLASDGPDRDICPACFEASIRAAAALFDYKAA